MLEGNNTKETNRLEPIDFKLETSSIWSFPQRGNWASHSGSYRGNWSPYIPRNVLLRYSKKGDLVLDQFVGSGTTMIEAMLLERKGIGIDINPNALKMTQKNLTQIKSNDPSQPKLYLGDARRLNFIDDERIDLICTHPPYSHIIKYSNNISGDLSILNINEFMVEIELVAKEAFRILKQGKYCAIMMGDVRKNKNIIPLGFETMNRFTQAGFTLKEIIIKEQHNCNSTKYWESKSIEYNFLLIAHEYLFIFYKG